MLLSASALWVLVGALIVDALIGDPAWLWRRVPHPVTWLGALVDGLDGALNRATWSEGLRRGAGVLALLLLVAIGAWIGWEIETGLRRIPYGEIPLAIVASVFLAQRSLYQHVGAVHAAFGTGGLTEARRAVSQIVGRDPESLDESGVSRATIESCAENFSDGVVAPAFWFALFGLPGLIVYKAVNTADSMIGHRTARHEAFGWASARFDDLVNLVPARLSGLLIALASGKSLRRCTRCAATRVCIARRMRAGRRARGAALGVALAGPRRYGDGSSATRSSTRAAAPRGRTTSALVARIHRRVRAARGALRRARARTLTAARDRDDAIDVEMRLEMIGERVERLLDPLLVGELRRDRELRQPGVAEFIRCEQPVHIGAAHAPVARRRAVGTIADREHGPRAVRPFGAAEMDLVAADRRAGRAVTPLHGDRRFVGRHLGHDIEQTEPLDAAGRPFDAARIGDGAAEHLVAAAQPEHVAAAPRMRLDVDVPALCRMNARSPMVDFEPGRITTSASPGSAVRGARIEGYARLHAERIEIVEIRDARQPIPGDAHVVILPGSKSTIGDLAFLRQQGWDIDIKAHARRGGHVLGLCGGYQMLGRTVADPRGIEGPAGSVEGLGLLDVVTEMTADKSTIPVQGRHCATGAAVRAQIHLGHTEGPDCARPMLTIGDRPDGAASRDGRVRGTYVHGLFTSDEFRRAWLAQFAVASRLAYEERIEQALDALADHLEAHLDVDRIVAIARGRQNKSASAA